MHASTEQLLILRDGGDVPAGLAHHVADCAVCSSELASLGIVRDALRALPLLSPPAGRWDRIVSRIERRQASSPWPRIMAVAGVAASAMVAALLLLRMPGQVPSGAPVSMADADSSPAVVAAPAPRGLLAESQRLEALIGDYRRQRPVPDNPGLAGTLRSLEDRIALVDYGLTYATEADLDGEQFDRLWQQRVDLMNSIAHVRGAELRRVEYFEGLR